MKLLKKTIPACYLCGAEKGSVFRKVEPFTYYTCGTCDGVFAHPRKEQTFYLETETYLTNAESYAASVNLMGQRWMIEQFERLYATVTGDAPRTNLLEIGAGGGYFTMVAVARGWDAKGIETSKSAVDFANKFLRVQVDQSTVEGYKSKEKFGSFAMIEVLEHFLDPVVAVNNLRRLGAKSFFLFGTTPNTDSAHWRSSEQNIYVPDDHIFLFNKKSFDVFAEKVGLTNYQVEFFGSGKEHDSNLMYAGLIES